MFNAQRAQLWLRPTLQNLFDSTKDASASLMPVPTRIKQTLVLRMYVAYMRANGESNRFGVETLGIGGAAHSP